MASGSIGFVGGGRVTRIFLEGLSRAGGSVQNIVVSDTNGDALIALQQSYPGIEIAPNDNTRPAACDVVFLAVHPPVMGSVLSEVAAALRPGATVVSLAPKFTIPKLTATLGGFDRIARMIPNAASVVGAGYNPISFSPALSDGDKAALLAFLGPLGESPTVPDQNLEAYAIVTAMGPTYFWFQWSELKRIAQSLGLSETDAELGIKSMLSGAMKTMFESGMSEAAVIDLIPVKPLGENEADIKATYASKLPALYEKLTS